MKINASQHITVRITGGVIVFVAACPATTLTFIGASCQASAIPGSDYLTSFSLTVNKGEKVVVALSSYTRMGKSVADRNLHLVYELTWEGDLLKVDLEEIFVPKPGRLYQIDQRKDMTVHAGQQKFVAFASPPCDLTRKEFLNASYRIIPDANMLCKFIAGDIELTELESGAGESEVTILKRQVEIFDKELTSETAKHSKTREALARAHAAASDAHQKFERSDSLLKGIVEILTGRRWWKFRQIKELLVDYMPPKQPGFDWSMGK